jgi:predicted PhzF superfamily epimerase YddE/YHI9
VSPAAAFLAAHRLAAEGEAIVVNQGRFLGRPSVIALTPDGRGDLGVGGPVAPVARGVLDLPSD